MSGEFEAQLDALMVAHKNAAEVLAGIEATINEAMAAEHRLFEAALAATTAALAELRTAIKEQPQ